MMKAQIVSFHCILKDQMGRVLSSSFNHEVITHIEGRSEMIKGLSLGLKDLRKGERRTIEVPAQDAYGLYDASQVMTVSRRKLGEEAFLHIGCEVMAETERGES